MTTDRLHPPVPKLRFPEFRNAGDWRFQPLSDMAELISEKVGTSKCVPMSVTTGVGLLSQEEKFGRIIAGNSYKNYIRLQTNDFAYNKSATKEFPQGYIARYSGAKDAAVPNSIFTCFRPQSISVIPEYLDYLLHGNHHGRWLRKYITVGARAHGALSVSNDALMSLPVPLPPIQVLHSEQQKIADCLSSLDDLIAAETQKLKALQQYKQGLMQQLFPQPSETVPRLRFPKFESKPSWIGLSLAELEAKGKIEFSRGKVISRADMRTTPGPYPVYSSSVMDEGLMGTYGNYMFDEELISWSVDGGGHFFYRPKHKFSVTNVSGFMRILCSNIVCRFLAYQLQQLHGSQFFNYQQKAHPSVIRTLYKVGLPESDEQHKIADCLGSLDNLIAAVGRKIEALLQHKQGLMQQLFPVWGRNEDY